MTAECLGIEYTFKEVNLMKGEHMTPEYLKINPQHNIPTVIDGNNNFFKELKFFYISLINSGTLGI